jgi:hypothetical protein
MSLGIIPPSEYEVFREALFNAYIEGLRQAGWRGPEAQARFGYSMSTALRSVWEVPQFFSVAEQLKDEPDHLRFQERYALLETIIKVHILMAEEADVLLNAGKSSGGNWG